MAEEKPALKITLQSTLLQSKKTATGIEIPEAVVQEINAGKKPPVKVTINGYLYRTSIASMGGKFMLPVSSVVRENAKIKSGETITVEIELDRDAREVELPVAFAAALDLHPEAKKFFDSLSNSNKQRFVFPIVQAKTEETKQRRLEKAISDLAANKKM